MDNLKMTNIKVGDIVKKKACETTGLEAWVLVLEVGSIWELEINGYNKYKVLKPDGTVSIYTDAVLEKEWS